MAYLLPAAYMSLSICCVLVKQLPPNITCGAVCESFPGCLPSPSPGLLRRVAWLRTQAANDRQNYTAQALEAIHEALGIEANEGEQE